MRVQHKEGGFCGHNGGCQPHPSDLFMTPYTNMHHSSCYSINYFILNSQFSIIAFSLFTLTFSFVWFKFRAKDFSNARKHALVVQSFNY